MKKVTARQLMIGDWVKWRSYTRSVRWISESHIILNWTVDFQTEKECIAFTATPIPITEEWLKRNGWEMFNPRELVYYNGIKRMFYSFSEKRFSNDGFNAPNIAYIHQLQQAYRLATNKELKVKF